MGRVVIQKDIIDEVAEEMGVTKKSIKEVLDVLEKVVYSKLRHLDDDDIVEVKLLHGLNLLSSCTKEHKCLNPQSGNIVDVPAKIKVRAKIGKQVKDGVNK